MATLKAEEEEDGTTPSSSSSHASHSSLVVLCGNAAVGKTTLAMELCRRSTQPAASTACGGRGRVLLDIDTVSETLVQAGLRGMGLDINDRDSPQYKQLYRDAIHETLFSIASQNLPFVDVVIVAPFTKERRSTTFLSDLQKRCLQRETKASLSPLPEVKVDIVFVTCDDEVRKERMQRRGNPRDESKFEDWAAYVEVGQDPPGWCPPFPHTVVNTADPSSVTTFLDTFH